MAFQQNKCGQISGVNAVEYQTLRFLCLRSGVAAADPGNQQDLSRDTSQQLFDIDIGTAPYCVSSILGSELDWK